MSAMNKDPALFMSKKNGGRPDPPPTIVSLNELRTLREDTKAGKKTEACFVTNADIAEMKKRTIITTNNDVIAEKKMQATMQEKQAAASNARKARMQAMDRERAHKVPPTIIESEQKDQALGLLAKAQAQMDEEHDDVKHMNQMVMYSKIVTVRDKQLLESKILEEEWVKEQKRLDLMMEIERLKSLQAAEDRDTKQAIARKQGAAVIIDQIKEREQERIKQRELLEKEKVQMLKNIEQLKRADQEAIEKKRIRNKEMIAEVEKVNKVALGKKAEKIQKEKNEDLEIVRYEAEKRAREELALEEERKIKDEKEKEIQRLRDLQERAADRQSEIDALRQKRAFEEGERAARAKEIAEAEKRARQARELDVARKRQFLEREEMLSQQAKLERDSFLRVIEEQKRSEEQERIIEDEKKHHLRNHATTIRAQIGTNAENNKHARLDYLEEGRKVRQKLEDERLKVEGIKKQKLASLQDIGIEDKYQAELAKKKIA